MVKKLVTAGLIGGGGKMLLTAVDMWDGHADFISRSLIPGDDYTFGGTVLISEVHERAIGLGSLGGIFMAIGIFLLAKALLKKRK
jgi:hypothetical protein